MTILGHRVAICTERVEAKKSSSGCRPAERVAICTERVEAKEIAFLLALCGPAVAICTERVEAKPSRPVVVQQCEIVAICTERVEAKEKVQFRPNRKMGCNLHGACGGKVLLRMNPARNGALQSARSVWRQSDGQGISGWRRGVAICTERVEAKARQPDMIDFRAVVAICTGRVEDLASSPEKNPRKFMQTYCIFIHLGV